MRSIRALIVLALLGLLLIPQTASSQVIIWWLAHMSGSEVVPPNDSPGWAYMECWFPPYGLDCFSEHDSLEVYLSYGELEGSPTGAEIRQGEPGANGDLVVQLRDSQFQSQIIFRVWFPDVSCTDLDEERLYVVVKSSAYPEGEVRGQVRAGPVPVSQTSWGGIRALYR